MPIKRSTYKVLVTLDSIMDTRIAAIAKHSEGLAKQLLESGKYQTRRHNQWNLLVPNADTHAINELYDNRDMEILKMSVATPIVGLLSELVSDARIMRTDAVERMDVVITLNLSPYIMKNDTAKLLADALLENTLAKSVDTSYIKMESLTPSHLAKYDVVILDDIEAWLPNHLKEIEQAMMKDTLLYVPEIIRSGLGEIEAIPKEAPGKVLSLLYAEYLKIEVLPLQFYNLIPPEMTTA